MSLNYVVNFETPGDKQNRTIYSSAAVTGVPVQENITSSRPKNTGELSGRDRKVGRGGWRAK
jgi:hypothetical protein